MGKSLKGNTQDEKKKEIDLVAEALNVGQTVALDVALGQIEKLEKP